MKLRLFKLNNCFNDGPKTHLGLKYKGKWYCITHHNNNKGVVIPKYFLTMLEKSEKNEYLKLIENSAPNVVSRTNMFIHSRVLEQYDKYKLDSLKNERKRYKQKMNYAAARGK